MDDHRIEETIIHCIHQIIEETEYQIELASIREDGFEILLRDQDGKIEWYVKGPIDALSCVILMMQPAYSFASDDNAGVAAIMKLFGKSGGWVRSFQGGWRGINNSSNSISGWWMGHKTRMYYEKNCNEGSK